MKRIFAVLIFAIVVATTAFASYGFAAYNEDVYAFYYSSECELDLREIPEEWDFMRKINDWNELDAADYVIETSAEWAENVQGEFMDIHIMVMGSDNVFLIMSQDDTDNRLGNILEALGYV